MTGSVLDLEKRNAVGYQSPPFKRFKLLSQDTLSRTVSKDAHCESSCDIEKEISAYICSVHSFSDGCGLAFWVEKESAYPLLAPLAQDLLSAPASEAYVERVFSVCGELTSGKRNRLSKNLENRFFLRVNKKYYDI